MVLLLNYHQINKEDKKHPNKKKFRIIRQDGNTRWLEGTSTNPTTFQEKQCYITFIKDITNLKKKEEDNKVLINCTRKNHSRKIAKLLKDRGVEIKTISEATDLDQKEINKL